MEIISHRGLWNNLNEKNTNIAFHSSFKNKFGTETDIRDYNGNLVISHDIADANSLKFEEFINRYPNLFITNETKWFDKLNYVKTYINEKQEIPKIDWLNVQTSLSKKRLKIFKNDNIFNAWNIFVIENKEFLQNDEATWENKYNLLNSFVEKEKRLPIKFKDEHEIGLLSKWIYDQNRFYILAPKNGVMSNTKYKIIWKTFIDKYRYLFSNHKLKF